MLLSILVYKLIFTCEVSSTLKKPSKNYTCFILRRFGLFLIHLQSKNKATLGNAGNSKPKDSDARNNSVMQKTSKAKPRPPALSKSLKVKVGPTAMEKVLKQNRCKVVIYENKPRPAEKYYSQSTAQVVLILHFFETIFPNMSFLLFV